MGKKTVAAVAALVLGGGGLVAVNVYASATDDQGGQQLAGSTINCPEVVAQIPEVPDSARQEVDQNLAELDNQVAEAYQKWQSSREEIEQDANFTENAIISPLEDKRAATIEQILTALGQANAQEPENLGGLADCEMQKPDGEAVPAAGEEDQDQGGEEGQDQGEEGEIPPPDEEDPGAPVPVGEEGNGPAEDDFVDITTVEPNVEGNDAELGQAGEGAANGIFETECGTNENGNFNSDNVIAAPGVSNGAHHTHDYVGNQDSNAQASDDTLAAAETTCANQEDQSSYYWPVVRLQNGVDEQDAQEAGGGLEGNVGEIQQPASAQITFEGDGTEVTEMPRFLRIITGDAKSFTNGDANANASWSCEGFEDQVQLKDKYPLCPEGSQTIRTIDFPSCWDGQNTDSADHRSHVAFANEDGSCDNGFQAIPKMVHRIAYDLPAGETFALDSFPEQLHKPITDHSDFINVMSEELMSQVVDCINSGQQCVNQGQGGAGDAGDAGAGDAGDAGDGAGDAGAGDAGDAGAGDAGDAGDAGQEEGVEGDQQQQ